MEIKYERGTGVITGCASPFALALFGSAYSANLALEKISTEAKPLEKQENIHDSYDITNREGDQAARKKTKNKNKNTRNRIENASADGRAETKNNLDRCAQKYQ